MTTAPDDLSLSIRLVLVHHQDRERLTAVRETVETVAAALSTFGGVEITELSRQPDMRPLSTRTVMARMLRQWRLERRWAAHLGVGPRWVLSAGLLLLRMLRLSSGAHRANASRQAFIELSLSAKHQLAWRQAAEDGVDVLMVLEDDARARPETNDRLHEVLTAAGADLSRTYADLAGGLTSRQLRTDAVTRRVSGGAVELSKPSTNTTCAYLIGSEVIASLADRTTLEPQVGRLPADWLMNSTFMSAAVRCLHASPTALDHGSFTGAVDSSIRP